jgi:NADPH-dependent curcumin reductase CurA
VLTRTLYLSLDPYMRGRMSDAPSYTAPLALGEVMVGGTVGTRGRLAAPGLPGRRPGVGYGGWQDYALAKGADLTRLDTRMRQPSLALGVLGMPGFTAYMGLLDIGQPKAGETVVVAAASGAVGSVVGQLARLKGCRVVGVAGGADKCRFVVERVGLRCLHRPSHCQSAGATGGCLPERHRRLLRECRRRGLRRRPALLNVSARVPVCGLIAHYNDTGLPPGPDRLGLLTRTLLTRRIRMQGFIIFDDYGTRYGEFFSQMSTWLKVGKIKFREDIVDGLENAPQAFIGLLEGRNFGKLIIRVGSD